MTIRILFLLFAIFSLAGRGGAQSTEWTQTAGPSGSLIEKIVKSPANNHLYLATKYLFRSTDNGVTWARVFKEQPGTLVDVHVMSSGTVLALINARNRQYFASSTDDGVTWVVEDKFAFFSNGRNSITSTSNGTIYAVANRILRSSTDIGETWTGTDLGWTAEQIWALDTVLIVDQGKRSTNGGKSWGTLMNGFPPGIRVVDLATFPNGLSVAKGDGVSRNFATKDLGRTWEYTYLAPDTRAIDMSGNQCMISGLAPYGSAISRPDSSGFYMAWEYYAPDEFGNWHQPKRLVFSTEGGEFLSVINDGLYYSDTSTKKWFERDLPIGQVRTVLSHPTGRLIASSFDENKTGSSWTSSDNGVSWKRVTFDVASSNPDPYRNPWVGFTAATLDSSMNIIASSLNTVYRSTDGGATFIKLGGPTFTSGFSSLAVAPNGYIYGATHYEGLLRSTDNGLTWDELDYGINGRMISAIGVDHSGAIYAGSRAALYKSTDQAMTWQPVGADFIVALPACGKISSIVVNNAGALLVGTDSAGMLISTDQGLTFSLVNSGLPSTAIRALVNTPSDKVFAATDSGVYFLADTTTEWESLSQGLSAMDCLGLTRDASGRLFVGTNGAGVSYSTKTYNKIASKIGRESQSIALKVYPNPSVDRLTVIFSSDPEHLEIRDLLGRVISLKPIAIAGQHATFNVSTLAGGIYEVISQNGEHARFRVIR